VEKRSGKFEGVKQTLKAYFKNVDSANMPVKYLTPSNNFKRPDYKRFGVRNWRL